MTNYASSTKKLRTLLYKFSLVDIGSELSFINPTTEDLFLPPDLTILHAANGIPITNFVTRFVNVSRLTAQICVVIYNTDIPVSMLGADLIADC